MLKKLHQHNSLEEMLLSIYGRFLQLMACKVQLCQDYVMFTFLVWFVFGTHIYEGYYFPANEACKAICRSHFVTCLVSWMLVNWLAVNLSAYNVTSLYAINVSTELEMTSDADKMARKLVTSNIASALISDTQKIQSSDWPK